MTVALKTAASLREMLRHYEVSLGLTELTSIERDVLFAFRLVQEAINENGLIASEDVKRHSSLTEVSHASYHRAVKGLVRKGFLNNERYGAYRITKGLEEAVA